MTLADEDEGALTFFDLVVDTPIFLQFSVIFETLTSHPGALSTSVSGIKFGPVQFSSTYR